MQDFKLFSLRSRATLRRGSYSLVFLLVLFLAVVGCGGKQGETAKEPRNCLAGEPRPIFKTGDNGVYEHNFIPEGQLSQEFIRFTTGELLTILQTGCDTLIQTFEIPVPDSVQTWPSFRRLALKRFNRYGNLDPRHYAFGQYAKALEVLPPDFPIARPANLAPGLTVRFFKIPSNGGTTWQVVYEQDLTQIK